MVRESQPYVLPIIPRLESKVLVLDEHQVLKDLPFYEEAWEENAKTRQDRLDQKEKKRQGGTLRQALGVSRLASSSTSYPPNTRKPVIRPIEKVLNLSLFVSSSSLSSKVDTDQGSTGSPSIETNPNQELEPVVPCIILELKEEE